MKLLVKQLLSYIPTKIPVGMTQFNTWLSSIEELCGPIADSDSIKWVISNEVMRLSPTRDKVPKRFFVKTLRKYAANQLAAATVMDLKMKQEEARKSAEEQNANKKSEDTAADAASSNVQ